MTLRIPLVFIARLIAYLALLAVTCAFTPGQTFRATGVEYKLEKQLGSGAFGEVWEATVTDTRTGQTERITLKFYHRPEDAGQKLETLKRVERLMRGQTTPNLMPVRGPMLIQDTGLQSGSTAWFSVVRGIPGEGDVASLRPGEFAIQPGQTPDERARRVRNTYQLMNDLVAASEQVHALDLVHHDLNPRNIIRVGGRYRANDFEGATAIGDKPPTGAWEFGSAAPEYGDGEITPHSQKMAATYGPLGDLWTAASTVYFAQHGETPLTTFTREKYPALFAEDQKRAYARARRDLLQSEHSRALFRQMVRDKTSEYFERAQIPSAAVGDFQKTARFLSAALEPLPLERREALARERPELPQLKREYPKLALLPPPPPIAPIARAAVDSPPVRQPARRFPISGKCAFQILAAPVAILAVGFAVPNVRDLAQDRFARSQFDDPRIRGIFDRSLARDGLGFERDQAVEVAQRAARENDPEKFFADYQRAHQVARETLNLYRREAMAFSEKAAEQKDPAGYLNRVKVAAVAPTEWMPGEDKAALADAFARSELPVGEATAYADRFQRARNFAYHQRNLTSQKATDWAVENAGRSDFEAFLKQEKERR